MNGSSPTRQAPSADEEDGLLDSWKEIAGYLRRSERTVRRWEATEGLPVHRHQHRKRGTVRGYKPEIDIWWRERGTRLPEVRSTEEVVQQHEATQSWLLRPRVVWTAVALVVIVLAAENLRIRRQPEPQPSPEISGHGVSQDANDGVVRGELVMDRVTGEGLAQSIQYFHRAINADPGRAQAYVGLADSYLRSAVRGLLSSREAYPLAKAAATRAVRLDDTSAEAHVLLGVIRFRWEWDWDGAERELKRALTLDPNSSRVRLGVGTFLLMKGRFSEAVTEGTRSLELDPLSPQRHVDLALKLGYANQQDAALQVLRETFELNPNFAPAFSQRATIYAAKGRRTEAVDDCNRALQLAPEDQWSLGACGRVYVLAGQRRQSMQVVDTLRQLSSNAYSDAYLLALVFDALGDTDQAARSLQRAYDERSPNLSFLRIDMPTAKFAADPRPLELLRRIKLAR